MLVTGFDGKCETVMWKLSFDVGLFSPFLCRHPETGLMEFRQSDDRGRRQRLFTRRVVEIFC